MYNLLIYLCEKEVSKFAYLFVSKSKRSISKLLFFFQKTSYKEKDKMGNLKKMSQALWGAHTFTTVCIFLIVLLSFGGLDLESTAVATPGTEREGVGAQDVVSMPSFAAFTSVLLILV